jgi:hypothetical protein
VEAFVAGVFAARVFFVIFAPVLAFDFGAADFVAVGFVAGALDPLSVDFIFSTLASLVVFFGALVLGFEILAVAGGAALASGFLVFAARAGCLRRSCDRATEVIADGNFIVGRSLR